MTLTFGSLFAGVGGFDMGFEQAGWDCKFQVEWDNNCQQILNKHWPDVPKWGDVSDVDGAEIPPVDCIIFGSPCQDLSVAGKRAGLEGERSGLFHEAVRIIKEMRDATNGTFPRWTVWENVAGALSSNNGRDFGTVINEMAKAGAHLQEYALLDAQYFGIPQRRRRVFLISCFDPAASERCPNPLLPVTESLPGDTKKGKSKGKEPASQVAESFGSDGQWAAGSTEGGDILRTSVTSKWHKGSGGPSGSEYYNMVVEGFTPSSFANYTEGVGTLRSNGGDLGGGSETLVAEPMLAFDTQFGSNANVFEDQSPTLKASQQSPSVAYPIDTRNALRDPEKYDAQNRQGLGIGADGDPMATLTSAHINAVAYDEYNDSINDIHHALRAGTKQSTGVLEPTMAVRRLTPLECERLMGWPDEHTRYKADGTEQADTHRYKQCGNGVATPVAKWVALQIGNVEYAEG